MHTFRVKARDHRLIYAPQLLTQAFPQSSKHKKADTRWNRFASEHLALTLPTRFLLKFFEWPGEGGRQRGRTGAS